MSELTQSEEISLGSDFGTAELNNDIMQSADELDDDTPRKQLKVVAEDEDDEAPPMWSPKWSEFVMKQFEEDELDPEGRPLVHGLRRVARLLLGPIIQSSARVIQAPSLLNNLEKVGWLQPATVEYTIVFLWCRDLKDTQPAYEATFTDAADVYHGNTDMEFARHATATASTKAEARCLRKALQLKGIAGEEKTAVPSIEAALDGKITPEQVNYINSLCRRNKMNAMAYVNSGKKKYASVWDIEAGVAAVMVEHLSGIENSGKVPEALRGYDPKWLS